MPGPGETGYNFPIENPPGEPEPSSPLLPSGGNYNFPTEDPPGALSGSSGNRPGFNFPTAGNPGIGAHLEINPGSSGGFFKWVDGSGNTIDQRAPDGVLGHALDILSRGQYMSAAFVDTLLSGDGGPAAIGRAFTVAGGELIDPSKRLSYRDLLKTHAPVWSARHPFATNILGFVGDVALDPVTYLSWGSGPAIRILGKGGKAVTVGARTLKVGEESVALSRAGKQVFKQVIERKAAQGLSGEALRESSEKMMSRLASSSRWSDVLQDAGGLKFAGRQVIGNRAQHAVNRFVSDTLGLSRVKEAIKQLPGVGTVRRTFQRNADLPKEYVDLRHHLESETLNIEGEVRDEAIHLFGKLSKKERTELGRLSNEIYEKTVDEGKRLGRSLTPDEARHIRDQHLFEKGVEGDMFTVFQRMSQRYQQLGEIEQQAGMLNVLVQNYTHRRYSVIRDAESLTNLRRRWYRRLGNTFTPAEHKKFGTMAESIEAGFDPVLDAAVLYTNRVLESRQTLARRQFSDAVESVFGGKDKIPGVVRRDVTYIGEGVYSRGMGPEANHYLKLYDGMMGLFRRSATVVRPAFGSRNAVSNVMQSYSVMGARALGVFDPRTTIDAMHLLNGKPGIFTLRSAVGHSYNGEDVLKLAKEHGVIRGIALEGVGAGGTTERMARGVAAELDRINRVKKVAGDSKAAEGLAKFITGLTRYTNWPSKIEDFGRLTTFMNALRVGHNPGRAAKLVNDALFDYSHGLSAIETRLMRRIIPFYSFQRFAIPMLTRAALTAPGRIINPVKAANTFFRAWSQIAKGETLNESERAAIPGWILEQPSTFEKLDDDHKAVFRTFNNFTPLDTFSFVQTDESGELDVEGTLKKGFLAQMTPFIKVPLEFAVRKNFFTGRSLPKHMIGARQRAGDLDADRVLRHLAGITGAELSRGSLFGMAGGHAAASLVGSVPGGSEAALKAAFGWEEGIDPKTGQRQVYINPFLVQSYTAINPALNDAFRIGRDDRTPLERTMQWLFGIGTTKIDLEQQKEFKLRDLNERRTEIVAQIRRAQKEGRESSLQYHQRQLTEFLKQMQYESQLLTRQPVRGAQ